MIKLLPDYYQKSELVEALYDAIKHALDEASGNLDETERDIFLITADNLDLFLKNVGLEKDAAADKETLRSMILSRLRGGDDLLTRERLSELIMLYEPSEFEIEEEGQVVTVRFIQRKGLPRNIKQLIDDVENIKPAHVSVTFLALYTTWGDASKQFRSWGAARAVTWGDLSELNKKEE